MAVVSVNILLTPRVKTPRQFNRRIEIFRSRRDFCANSVNGKLKKKNFAIARVVSSKQTLLLSNASCPSVIATR